MMSLIFNMVKRFASQLILDTKVPTIKNVTIIGGGPVGVQLAHVTILRGMNIVLVERTQEKLDDAFRSLNAALVNEKLFIQDKPEADPKKQLFIDETLKRYRGVHKLEEAVQGADLIVEAVQEDLVHKQKLFQVLDGIAEPQTIFTSTTSTLMISDIVSGTKRLQKCAGVHFFSPINVNHLIELVRIPETSDNTFQALSQWGTSLGKTCVTCRDTPGFIVNRLLIPYVAEAIRIVERGEATPHDVDTAMKLGCGYIVGPITFADFVGLDILLIILKRWQEKFPDDPKFKPPRMLEDLVKSGKLGNKTGEGFFKHDDPIIPGR